MSISTRKKVLDFKKMLSQDIENDDIKIDFNSRISSSSKTNSAKKNIQTNSHIAISNGNNSINNNSSFISSANTTNSKIKTCQLLGKKRKGKQLTSLHNNKSSNNDVQSKPSLSSNTKIKDNDKTLNNININNNSNSNKIFRKEYEDMLNEYEDELKFLEKANAINNKNFPWKDNVHVKNNEIDIEMKNIEESNDKMNSDINCKGNNKRKLSSSNDKTNEMKPSNIITDLNTLNYNLFLCTKFENSKPYKMIDYIISNDSLLLNRKGDKEKLEEIKKPIFSKSKTDINNNINILYKSLYEYFKTDFSSSFIYSLFEKVNHLIQTKPLNPITPSHPNEDKKDKFTYSSIISDRLKQNNSHTTLFSYTNDIDFVKSLIYLNNKFNKYLNKKNKIEKNLSQSLQSNLSIVEHLISEEQKQGNINNEEKQILHKLTRSKKFFTYIYKNFTSYINSLQTLQQTHLSKSALCKLIEIIATKSKEDEFDKTAKLFNEFQLSHSKGNGTNPVLLDKVQVRNIWVGMRFLFFLLMMGNRSNINSDYIENGFWKEVYDFTIRKIIAERHVKENSGNNEKKNGNICKGEEGKHEVKFQVPKVNVVYLNGNAERKEGDEENEGKNKGKNNKIEKSENINIVNGNECNENNNNDIKKGCFSNINNSNNNNNQSNNLNNNKKNNNAIDNIKLAVIERYEKGLDIFTITREKCKLIFKQESSKKEASHSKSITINNTNNNNNDINDNISSSSKTISEEDDDIKRTKTLHLLSN